MAAWVGVCCWSTAHADIQRRVSATVSPLHLALPMLEGALEYRVEPQLGLAVIGGYGVIEVDDGFTSTDVTVLEIGGQARYYLEDFSGWHAGVEALYLLAEAPGAVAEGLAAGAFGGWKYIGASGFTFSAQLGAATVGIVAESAGSEDDSGSLEVLLNLDFGWSL